MKPVLFQINNHFKKMEKKWYYANIQSIVKLPFEKFIRNDSKRN